MMCNVCVCVCSSGNRQVQTAVLFARPASLLTVVVLLKEVMPPLTHSIRLCLNNEAFTLIKTHRLTFRPEWENSTFPCNLIENLREKSIWGSSLPFLPSFLRSLPQNPALGRWSQVFLQSFHGRMSTNRHMTKREKATKGRKVAVHSEGLSGKEKKTLTDGHKCAGEGRGKLYDRNTYGLYCRVIYPCSGGNTSEAKLSSSTVIDHKQTHTQGKTTHHHHHHHQRLATISNCYVCMYVCPTAPPLPPTFLMGLTWCTQLVLLWCGVSVIRVCIKIKE